MKHPQLAEFAAAQLAKGVSVDEIIDHLRRQHWEEEVIREVITAATGAAAAAPDPGPPPAPKRRSMGRAVPVVLALLAVALLVTGLFVLRHYLVAKAIREKTKFVEFSGAVTGRFLPGSAAVPGAPTPGDFRLLDFKGVVDSAIITEPRAALTLQPDPAGSTAATLPAVPSSTDARYVATTLIAAAGGRQLFGGADLRWGGDSVFLRPERTPWSDTGGNNLVAGLLGAFLGQDLVANPWLRLNVGKPELAGEQQITWALLFRPAGQVFGTSKELSFLDRADGGELRGVPTEIHRYRIDGAWLTRQIREGLQRSSADRKMAALAGLQGLLTGTASGGGADSLEVTNGEMSVWVGRSDALPYRITARLQIKEGTSQPLLLELQGELDANYGQPVKIELPPDSVAIEKVWKQIEALQGLGNLFQR